LYRLVAGHGLAFTPVRGESRLAGSEIQAIESVSGPKGASEPETSLFSMTWWFRLDRRKPCTKRLTDGVL